MYKILSIVLALAVGGCATKPMLSYQTNTELKPGLTRQQVMGLLGQPPRREVYVKSNQTMVEYLIYPNVNRYELWTPICFINNRVVGWGKNYYEDHVDSDDIRIK